MVLVCVCVGVWVYRVWSLRADCALKLRDPGTLNPKP